MNTTSSDGLIDVRDLIPGVDAEDLGAFTGLSAGEVLTVTGDAGTYTELQKQPPLVLTFYSTADDESIPGAPPANLILDIPGDTFPQFSHISFPAVPTLTLTAPASLNDLTASSTFTWNGTNDADSIISIDISSTKVDLATFDLTSTDISCRVRDDGSFTLPANVAAEIGADFFLDSVSAYVSRSAFKFVAQNDATLLITRGSSVGFDLGFDEIPTVDADAPQQMTLPPANAPGAI